MLGSRRATDIFVNQGPTQVIDAGPKQLADAVNAKFDPGSLDVLNLSTVGKSGNGVHQHNLTPGRSTSRLSPKVYRCGHVNEGQSDEFGKPSRLLLEVTGND